MTRTRPAPATQSPAFPVRTVFAALPGRLAAVALIALLGTGCSKTPAAVDGSGVEKPAATGNSGTNATRDTGGDGGPAGAPLSPAALLQLLKERRKLAQCMRDNGVQDFPNPGPNGSILYYGDDPDMTSAREKCGGPSGAVQG